MLNGAIVKMVLKFCKVLEPYYAVMSVKLSEPREVSGMTPDLKDDTGRSWTKALCSCNVLEPAHRHRQSGDSSTQNNTKWQHPGPSSEFCLASRLLAPPVLCLIVMEHDCPLLLLLPFFFFSAIFTSAHSRPHTNTPHSPNFIVGHSPMYNSWVTRLFYTPRTDSPVVAPWGGLNQTSL